MLNTHFDLEYNTTQIFIQKLDIVISSNINQKNNIINNFK